MCDTGKIYVLGCGAVGLALAAGLAKEGRDVLAVRTCRDDIGPSRIAITMEDSTGSLLVAPVETMSLARLRQLRGMAVVTAKAPANSLIAGALAARGFAGPVILLQNGLDVERPFVDAGFPAIFRGVLYVTSQITARNTVTFRAIGSCPVGAEAGPAASLPACVTALTTPRFAFHAAAEVRREVWRKTIINVVFNSLCPLLDTDNGIFARDANVARLARELVDECMPLAQARGIPLSGEELMDQILKISRGSEGIFISTLQDIRRGRETEMNFLNLELARLAASMTPPVPLGKTRLLGKMVSALSGFRRTTKNSQLLVSGAMSKNLLSPSENSDTSWA